MGIRKYNRFNFIYISNLFFFIGNRYILPKKKVYFIKRLEERLHMKRRAKKKEKKLKRRYKSIGEFSPTGALREFGLRL